MTAASFQLTGYWISIVQNALVLTEFREITRTIILYLPETSGEFMTSYYMDVPSYSSQAAAKLAKISRIFIQCFLLLLCIS